MYRRRGSEDIIEREDSNENNNRKGGFRKSSSCEPTVIVHKNHLRKKSFTAFFSNLFGTKIPENRNSGISTQSSSYESVNTILSSNSFSFVNPKKYKGKHRGKRIPVVEPPPNPTKPRRISTLTRLGMKMGLKSKYNLQSCESLHHLSYLDSPCKYTPTPNSNTGTLNSTITTISRKKKQAPSVPKQNSSPKPGSSQQPGPSQNSVIRQSLPPIPATLEKNDEKKQDDDKIVKNSIKSSLNSSPVAGPSTFKITASHRRCCSEGSTKSPKSILNTSTMTNSIRKRAHIRGKRRAPVPPNPFGDPDAPEETENDELLGVTTSSGPMVSPLLSKISSAIPEEPKEKSLASFPGSMASPSKISRDSPEEKSLASSPGSMASITPSKISSDLPVEPKEKLSSPSSGSMASSSPSKVSSDLPGESKERLLSSSSGIMAPSSPSKTSSDLLGEPKEKSLASYSGFMAASSPIKISSNLPAEPNEKSLASPGSMASLLPSKISSDSPDEIREDLLGTTSSSGSMVSTSPSKISPRPWYKRNPSSGNSNKKQKQLIKPVSNMIKFSDIDREATRIVQLRQVRLAFYDKMSLNGQDDFSSPPQINDHKDGDEQRLESTTLTNLSEIMEDEVEREKLRQIRLAFFDNKMASGSSPPPQVKESSIPPTKTEQDKRPVVVAAVKEEERSEPNNLAIDSNSFNMNNIMNNNIQPDKDISTPSSPPQVKSQRERNDKGQEKNGGQAESNNLASANNSYNIYNNNIQEDKKEKFGKKILNVFIDDEDDSIDALLQIPNIKSINTSPSPPRQENNDNNNSGMSMPNFSGPRNWNPSHGIHSNRFHPILESILEASNPIYENWNLSQVVNSNNPSKSTILQENDGSRRPMANTFMQIHDEFPPNVPNSYYANSDSSSCSEHEPTMDGKNRAPSRRHGSSHHHHSRNDNEGQRHEQTKLTLEDYRKLGAIPKNYLREANNDSHDGGSSSQNRDDKNHRRHSQNSQHQDYANASFMGAGDKSNVSDSNCFGNTFAVSKLLRKLEWAIANGEHRLAANLASDLAVLKINCVVAKGGQKTSPITILVYVEDRFMQQGPFHVQVTPQMTVKELKGKIEKDWEIPSVFQKWILGRKIAEDDTQILSEFEVVHDSMAFLYLVTPNDVVEKKSAVVSPENSSPVPPEKKLSLDNQKIVSQPIVTPDKTKSQSASANVRPDTITEKKSALVSSEISPQVIVASEKKLSLISPKIIPQAVPAENPKQPPVIRPESIVENKSALVTPEKESSATVLPEKRPPRAAKIIPQPDIPAEKKLLPVNPKILPQVTGPIEKIRPQATGPTGKKSKIIPQIPIFIEKSKPPSVSPDIQPVAIVEKKLMPVSPKKLPRGITVATERKLVVVTPQVIAPHEEKVSLSLPLSNPKSLPQATVTIEKKVPLISPKISPPPIVTIDKSKPSPLVPLDVIQPELEPEIIVQKELNIVTAEPQTIATEKPLASPKTVPLVDVEEKKIINEIPLPVTSQEQAIAGPFESGPSPVLEASASAPEKEQNVQTYLQMLQIMEQSDIIQNSEEFECPICFCPVNQNKGVVLRDCLHSFCKECLIGSIRHADDPQVKCPFRDDKYSCPSSIPEREIKALLPPELFEKYLTKSVQIAEGAIINTFHCKTKDCGGWCVFEDDVNIFKCPVCNRLNCLNCQAIHENMDCKEYQRQLAIESETDEHVKSSRLMLEKMIQKGEALECPACHVVLIKKWGCDWVRCSYCKTEICWITRGFRWGPAGKGDTSAGCKCAVNGVRCHPKCTYCH